MPRRTRAQRLQEEQEERDRVEAEHNRPPSPLRSGATPALADEPQQPPRPQNQVPQRNESPTITELERNTRLLLNRANLDQQQIFRGLLQHINMAFAQRIDGEVDEEQLDDRPEHRPGKFCLHNILLALQATRI